MSPMLKDRRKNQKCKSKEKDRSNELKTTLQIGQNVNDLIVLNSMFQVNKDESNNRCEKINNVLLDKVSLSAQDTNENKEKN